MPQNQPGDLILEPVDVHQPGDLIQNTSKGNYFCMGIVYSKLIPNFAVELKDKRYG